MGQTCRIKQKFLPIKCKSEFNTFGFNNNVYCLCFCGHSFLFNVYFINIFSSLLPRTVHHLPKSTQSSFHPTKYVFRGQSSDVTFAPSHYLSHQINCYLIYIFVLLLLFMCTVYYSKYLYACVKNIWKILSFRKQLSPHRWTCYCAHQSMVLPYKFYMSL